MAVIICGIDVCAQSLDACIGRTGPWQRFQRSSDGIDRLAAFCRTHQVELVVMEASGGYEKLPFALLWEARLPSTIVNPRAVRRFAEAMGRLEKTDRIDAAMIAWYAETKQLVGTAPPSPTQRKLAAYVTHLRQLTQTRLDLRNQCRLVEDVEVIASFSATIAILTNQIRTFEHRIADLIKSDPLWCALDDEWRQIKGVADRTVSRLMAELPEIGTLSTKAVAKLVGVAPIADDSGKRRGGRAVRGGRASVRSLLFIVAEVVRRGEPDFREFHRRLSEAGKPKRLVRIALAHKLLTRLNAKARDVRCKFAQKAA